MKSIIKDYQLAAELLKTIAHPIRLRILLILAQEPSLNVSTLQHELKLDQSALSHHLIKMRDRGILNSDRRNRDMYYYLADPAFVQVIKLMLEREIK
ncbi:ArsR/SmtB family transcription factor [Spirosoma validum]|uniref:Helix-turn-helix transcriptional regulator n=1 Tax=Spirosoma validum TaxID=2771355 RepID=A0A927B7F7_9BACT|nr:metalloregulator ArsR/SmtB family transcription factor [Spirosoma validum]MBD2757100.1 helix-turn-helix transcriptional regulator [Spirosoma validum]